jgi:hypothetical protein
MSFIYPAAAMVFYIFFIGILNFYTRFKGTKEGSIKLGYFKHFDAKAFDIPEFALRIGRHYNHQYELPPIFILTCLACQMVNVPGLAALAVAWTFIVTRMGHSYIHLGSNHILKRALWFFLGWFCIIILWVFILMEAQG